MSEIKENTEIAKIEQPKTEVKTEPQGQTEPVKEETEQDRNWKKFREAREIERKKTEETARHAAEKEAEAAALKAALEAALNKPQQREQMAYEEDETEDQKIEKKVNALLALREAEYERKRLEQQAMEMPQKLRQVYPDFDAVVNDANWDYMTFHHPELARSLSARQQSFDGWSDVYNACKRYLPSTNPGKEQKKAEMNLSRPQPFPNSTTATGEGKPSVRLEDERKAANWARMQKTLKGLS